MFTQMVLSTCREVSQKFFSNFEKKKITFRDHSGVYVDDFIDKISRANFMFDTEDLSWTTENF